jgi:hypothetical protein
MNILHLGVLKNVKITMYKYSILLINTIPLFSIFANLLR